MTKRKMAVAVDVICDRNATTAQVMLLNTLASTTGSSKREQGDVYNEEIAIDLAVGRALVKLGWQLIRSGSKQVASATEEQETRKVLTGIRRLQRDVRSSSPGARLTLTEIKERYGKEAARRAEARRGKDQGKVLKDTGGRKPVPDPYPDRDRD